MQILFAPLDFMGGLFGRLPQKVRDAATVCVLLALLVPSALSYNGRPLSGAVLLIVQTALLWLLALLLWPKERPRVRLSPLPAALYGCFLLFLTLTGVLAEKGRLYDVFTLGVSYPLVGFALLHDDRARFLACLRRALTIALLIFLLVSALFYPIVFQYNAGYGGMLVNPNGAGYFLIPTFAVFVAGILPDRPIKKQIKPILLTALCTCYVLLSLSRTAMLSCGAILLCRLILSPKAAPRLKASRALAAMLSRFLLTLILAAAMLLVLYHFSKIRPALLPTAPASPLRSPMLLQTAGNDLIDPTTTPDALRYITDARLSTEGKTLNAISSGRLTIWQAFLRITRPLGRAGSEPVFIPALGRAYISAHNTALDYAVAGGAFCGAAYVLYLAVHGLKQLRDALESPTPYRCAMLCITAGFTVSAMLSSFLVSYNYPIALFFYFGVFAVCTKEDGAASEAV